MVPVKQAAAELLAKKRIAVTGVSPVRTTGGSIRERGGRSVMGSPRARPGCQTG